MGVLDRMGRVISANFNALLDQAEDPRKSISQTLRDMEQQLRLAKKELVRSVAAERQLKRKVEELEQELARWERRAELALEHGDDDLARQALMHKRRLSADRQRTEQLRAQQRGNALEMKSAWDAMQSKFRDFSARKNTIATQVAQAKAGGGAENLGGGGEAFAEFAAMEERIDGVDDVMDAQREVDQMLASSGSVTGMTRQEVELRFAELEGKVGDGERVEGDGEVEQELAQLKRRLRVKTDD
jgi:phage shock protein A